jgi:hypothetical protein
VPATAHGDVSLPEYAQVPGCSKAGSLAAASAAFSHRPIEDLQPERDPSIPLDSMISVSGRARLHLAAERSGRTPLNCDVYLVSDVVGQVIALNEVQFAIVVDFEEVG